MLIKRTIAFVLSVLMLLTLLPGCAATGSATPEAMAVRSINSVLTADGEDLFDCLLPSFSAAYRASAQFTAALTGVDMSTELVKEMLRGISSLYGIQVDDLSEIQNHTTVISIQETENTAIVRTLLVLEIQNQFDYCECYVTCSKLGSMWYLSNIQEQVPPGYVPTEEILPAAVLGLLTSYMDVYRLSCQYGTTFQLDSEVELDGEAVDLVALEATWVEIDKYKKKPNTHIFDRYLSTNTDRSPYSFEYFIIAYQEDPLMQISVAVSEITTGALNLVGNLSKEFWEGVDFSKVNLTSIKNKKIANIIIDYLSTMSLSTDIAEIENEVEVAKDHLVAIEELLKTDKAFSQNTTQKLLLALKNIKLSTPDRKATFLLSEMLELNENNAKKIAEQLYDLASKVNGTKVKISVDYDWDAPVIADFYRKLRTVGRSSSRKSIYAHLDNEILAAGKSEKLAKFSGAMDVVTKGLSVALNTADAQMQLAKYQGVLDAQEQYLTKLLEQAGCTDTELIINEVFDALNQTVAKGIVDNFLTSFSNEVTTSVIDELLDVVITDYFGAMASKGNLYLLALELTVTAADLLSNTEQTKLQVWALEDMYDAFLDAKAQLIKKIDMFYNQPTASNYEQLYYSAEYYKLLLNAGSNHVSSILQADANSLLSRFSNWLANNKIDLRLQSIEDAKRIPKSDAEALDDFLATLFPTTNN